MITTSNGFQTIVCDKCGKSQTAKEDEAGKTFFLDGWLMNQKATMYHHLCIDCQSSKQRRATQFVQSKFKNEL
jgi:hypothetical protein